MADNKTVVAKNVELHWASLADPKTTEYGTNYELQIQFTEQETADTLKEAGVKILPFEGGFKGYLKRKPVNAKGEETRVNVVDKDGEPMSKDAIRSIGNGSIGNVRIFSYEYKVGPRSGRAAAMTDVRVIEMKTYEAAIQDDF